MSNEYTDDQLERVIQEADERAHSGRLGRLRTLLAAGEPNPTAVDVLAFKYYEEARLCWYTGAFVGTIVMSQLALEEMLRSQYRITKGVGGDLNERRKVDDAGFADLVKQAELDGWLSIDEAAALHRLRRDYRNPYVHTHDLNKRGGASKPNYLTQQVKIAAPELLREGVEHEARETIKLLVSLFPTVSRRLWGDTMRTARKG